VAAERDGLVVPGVCQHLTRGVFICSRLRRDCSRCPIIESLPPEKSSPADNLPAKTAPLGIFAGKLLTEGKLFCERSYDEKTLSWGRQYFNKEETYQFRVDLSPGGFFIGETF